MELLFSTNCGELLPDVSLVSADGGQVRLSDYCGRLNVVLALAGRGDDADVQRLLDEISARYAELTTEDAEVVVLVTDPGARGEKRGWPFVVLRDSECRLHRAFNARDTDGNARPAVIIADRYGEIYAEFRKGEGQGMPGTDEILQWLFFTNSQCPECGVSEWAK